MLVGTKFRKNEKGIEDRTLRNSQIKMKTEPARECETGAKERWKNEQRG